MNLPIIKSPISLNSKEFFEYIWKKTFLDNKNIIKTNNSFFKPCILELDNEIIIYADIPEVSEENITISYEHFFLIISIKNLNITNTALNITSTKASSEVRRIFYIPNIDIDTLSLNVEDGELALSIKKCI
ncbi:Hsp20 family protein [Clostridium sp. YIM B02551]|uniref:Hsp20 family protein n=1 Tax=Clostridium sp. YIM B02551 TaxID=2910679 RepID=UPI001EEA86D9|nr:Hsp20 family protein [Clostridium sp. YIM B02551]